MRRQSLRKKFLLRGRGNMEKRLGDALMKLFVFIATWILWVNAGFSCWWFIGFMFVGAILNLVTKD